MGDMSRTRRLARAWGIPAALLGLAALSGWPVTTRQGVNGVVTVQRIPLWVKAAEFLVRDYRYRQLVGQILKGRAQASDQERVMAIFHWTTDRLRHWPRGWPLIDDHVYSIIVRGYGTADQFADVFTTLCAYAGVPATLVKLMSADRASWYMGGVRLEGHWCVFDPYWGVYFEHSDGRPVTWQALIDDPTLLVSTRRGPSASPMDYAALLRGSLAINPNALRPYAQMPWLRLFQELWRWTLPLDRPATNRYHGAS